MKKYAYSVPYRVDLTARVHHRTVIAATPDEARELVKIADPRFISTVRSPQRRAAVITGEAK